jgi:hypothetical protein
MKNVKAILESDVKLMQKLEFLDYSLLFAVETLGKDSSN